MEFFIDNIGENNLLNLKNVDSIDEENVTALGDPVESVDDENSSDENEDEEEEDDEDGDYGDLPPNKIDISHIIRKPAIEKKDPMEIELEEFCQQLKVNTECGLENKKKSNKNVKTLKGIKFNVYGDEEFDTAGKSGITKLIQTNVPKELANSKIDDETNLENPGANKKAKLKKIESSKTKGSNWFNMPATELTDEVKRDLEIIQMRSVLDPKHFYKKNDLKVLPKYFQVGKVLPSPLDYYSERGERKNKKKTIVDELMADAEFQRFNKRKYTETVTEKQKSGYHKANQKMKKLKRK